MIDSFFLRISLGLLSVSCTEFCIEAIVLCCEIELNFYLARIDKEQIGFNTLLL